MDLTGVVMGRRGFRRYRNYRSYFGAYAVSKRQELSSAFGGIDKDVEQLFLNLGKEDLDELLDYYAEEHGQSAATYARNTYPKWKKGTVQLSGKTAERLLNLVPPLLPFETRFALIKKLRSANFRKLNRFVDTSPEGWRDALGPVIAEVVSHGATANISDGMKNRIAWLADGDVAAAERLLLAAEQEEAINRIAYLNAEFLRLESLIAQLGDYQTSISHSIDLPQGSIHVHIAVPRVSMWQKIKNWLG